MASYQDPRETQREGAASRETKPKTQERQSESQAQPPATPKPVITDWASI